MAFDPTLPVDDSLVDAGELRSQFTGLDAKITAVSAVSGAQVDNTTTGSPGSSAGVSVQFTAGILHFAFTVPQGVEGPQGPAGEVTQSQLSNDLSNAVNNAMLTTLPQTSSNSNAVQNLNLTPAASYDPQQILALVNAYNDLLNALRR